ncbi:N-acetylneuraminate 9-O-acetyltransferase-like [Liolophura sinensis]|uniref:N-acetylneuraminate 9-O-acetyltransferase-like n=1 Tax=Liolophura sinensis TaxID=3198878 RepID=UPI0031592605
MLSSGKTSFCSDLKARVLLDSLVRSGFYMVPVILTYNLVILAQISTTGQTKFTRPDNNAEPEAYITKTSRDMFLFQDANFTKSLWFHPRNCTMHNYTQTDTRTCLHRHATQIGRSHFVFAGDSTMRIFHRAFISLVGDYKKPKPSTNSGANDKLNFTTKFYWIPLMLSGIQVLRDELGEHGKVYPTLMVYSCGLWHMKKTKTLEQIEYPSNFSAKFSKVLPYMTKLSRNAPFLWMKYDPIWDEYMTKWPSLVTKQVDTYHAVIEQKTAGKGIVIWRSSRKIIEMIGKPGYGEHDGIHLVRQPLLLKSQIIFNWHCNRFLDSKAGLCFADRPTTLEPPESSPDVAFPTTLVIIGFLTFFCVLIWSYRVHKSSQTDSGKEEEIQNIQSFFVSVVKLCIIMAYFYLCMR